MTHENKDDILDDLFAQARAQTPKVSDDLMARVLADAQQVQHDLTSAKAPTPHSSRGFGLFDLLGGWPALGGVAMAGITGLWIGIAPPASVEALSAQVFGTTDSVSLMGEASVWTELDVTDG